MSDEIQASPEMKKFFERLLKLKEYVKCQYDHIDNMGSAYVITDIYDRLDQIIKEKE